MSIGAIARGIGSHARRAPKIAGVLQQRTLKSISRAVGVGLHSGQRVELTLRPARVAAYAPRYGIDRHRFYFKRPRWTQRARSERSA